jgi:hypothetical protein
MTRKQDVETMFWEDISPAVILRYSKDDRHALREAWHHFTDALCKQGVITHSQYDRWLAPRRLR